MLNLRKTVEAVLARHRKELVVPSLPAESGQDAPRQTLAVEQDRSARVAQRAERFEQVKRLHERGISRAEIAQTTGLSIRTITRYLRQMTCPQYGRQRKSVLDPYLPWLRQQFAEGCRNASHLYREVHAQGYQGTYPAVASSIRYLRHPDQYPPPSAPRTSSQQTYSPRKVVWWIMKEPERLHPSEREGLTSLLEHCAEVAQAYHLTKAFQRLVTEQDSSGLDSWLHEAQSSALPEFQRWAWGLRQDEAAVRAAFQWPWSSGQVAGQVNRLKTIKRQM